MNFFSNRYDKPGRGIDPDAPQKRSFFRYIDIFRRKPMHFIKANLLYDAVGFIFALPFFIAFFFLFSAMFFASEQTGELSVYMAAIMAFFTTGAYISVMGIGPVTAGMTYIYRNYAREEHAWLWSDFKDNFKTNFKQAAIVYVTDIIVLVLLYVAFSFYSQMGGRIAYIKYVIIVITAVFMMMHMYIYQMMVTFELSLKDLYKNALLFTLGRLPSNIFVLLVVGAVHIVLPFFLAVVTGKYFIWVLMIFAALEIFMTQSLMSFLVNFNSYPKIKKYMLDPATAGKVEKRATCIFDDDVRASKNGEI